MAVTSMANSSIRDFTKFNRMSTVFGFGPYPCEYVVVAGGGGGSNISSGGSGSITTAGGGAGGYRSNVAGEDSGGGDSAESAISILPGLYSLVIGAGGAATNPGSDSTFNLITSKGGAAARSTAVGGSGGGRDNFGAGGAGTADRLSVNAFGAEVTV